MLEFESVEDILTNEEHEKLDVIATFNINIQSAVEGSLPSPELVLESVIAFRPYGRNRGNHGILAEYQGDTGTKRITLLEAYPELKSHLEDTWKNRSFKDIRNLGILRLSLPELPFECVEYDLADEYHKKLDAIVTGIVRFSVEESLPSLEQISKSVLCLPYGLDYGTRGILSEYQERAHEI